MSLYTDGKWHPGIGWILGRPVAKITRKHPDRHHDEVLRGTETCKSVTDARLKASIWADEKNRALENDGG